MDASAYPQVCSHMNKVFHSIDRHLYSILVFQLHCDPKVAALMIALWIWLEHITLSSLVPKIMSSPIQMIKGLADEAVFLLRCIAAVDPPQQRPHHFSYFSISPAISDPEISLTQALVGNCLSLDFLRQNRGVVASEIKKVVNGGCVRALDDLIEKALTRTTAGQLDSPSASSSSSRSVSGPPPRALGFCEAPRYRRALFATFSRGSPVSEAGIKYFFKHMFQGRECVEAVIMPPVKPPNQHPVFAVIVFTIPGIIHFVLNGTERVKLLISGKPVWVRKFIAVPNQLSDVLR